MSDKIDYVKFLMGEAERMAFFDAAEEADKFRLAAEELARLQKIEAAARDLMDNSPIGDNDKPYSSDVAGREFDALYLSLQPVT